MTASAPCSTTSCRRPVQDGVFSRARDATREALSAALVLFAWLLLPASASALEMRAGAPVAAPIGIGIVVMSDTLLTLDSNKPATSGPNTMFVHFRLTNNTGVTKKALRATLGGMNASVFLGGNQAASQYVTAMAPGGTADVYFFMSYARTLGVTATLTLTVLEETTGNTDATFTTVRTSSMISSGTGGTLDAQTLTATNLGMITYIDVTYIFAGISVGGTYNMQPAGSTSLDAGCFQLTGSEVRSSDHPLNIPVGATNQMYFRAASSYGGSGARVQMRFFFRVGCLGVTSQVKPYANETSGNTNLKYSSNYDNWTGGTGGSINFPAVGNPLTTAKGATPDSLTDGGTATYTVTVTNTSSAGPATLDSIVDVLPAGVRFDSLAAVSQVTDANSALIPAAGATGRIVFRSVPGEYWTVPASSALLLVYKVTIPTPEATYTNSATAFVALTAAGTATANVVVRRKSDLTVLKAGPDSGRVLDTLAYVITTSNLGPSAADSVVVTDTLPTRLTFLRASRAAAATTVLGGPTVVSWPAYWSLARDSTLRDTVWVTVADTGTATNLALAASRALDPVAANSNGSAPASRKTTVLLRELVRVSVTPDGLPEPARHIGGNFYTQQFEVRNLAKRPHAFDLLFGLQQATVFVTRDTLRTSAGATTGDSTRLSIANGATQTLTVVYSVTAGDPLDARFRLRARAVLDTTAADTGWMEVRRVRPLIALTKSVTPDDVVLPGTDLTYTIAYANGGEWNAVDAVVVDEVPVPLMLKLNSVTSSRAGTVEYLTPLSPLWVTELPTDRCGAPDGYTACVTHVRVSLAAPLPANDGVSLTAHTGTLSFVARVP